MKYATATKYGGDLVAAEACNYDSFELLKPLCPNCKEAVFLQKAHTSTSSKGKEFKVRAAWSHFRGVSIEQVASCENRVNNYSEKDKQRIASQARGQRLKLLQRWFMSTIRRHPLFYRAGQAFDKVASEKNHHPELIKLILDERTSGLLSNKKVAHSFIDFMFDKMLSDKEYNQNARDGQSPVITVFLDASLKSPTLNNKICHEVIDFLCSKSASPILEICAKNSFTASSGSPSFFGFEKTLDKNSVWILDLVIRVCHVPWATEFQRLEAESKARSQAA